MADMLIFDTATVKRVFTESANLTVSLSDKIVQCDPVAMVTNIWNSDCLGLLNLQYQHRTDPAFDTGHFYHTKFWVNFPHQPFYLPHQPFGNCYCPKSAFPLSAVIIIITVFALNSSKTRVIRQKRRTGRTRQTNTAVTADRAYRHKNIYSIDALEEVIEVNANDNLLKRTREVNCRHTADGNEFQTKKLSTKTYKYLTLI